MSETLLQPAYDTAADARALKERKAYYNHHARDLPPIQKGEAVRLQLPGEKQWTPGTCTGMVGPRSYRVRAGGTEYRRNRCHLIQRNEPPPDPTLLGEPQPPEASEQGHAEEAMPDKEPTPAQLTVEPPPPGSSHTAEMRPQLTATSDERCQPRRSTRQRRAPDWITSYAPS